METQTSPPEQFPPPVSDHRRIVLTRNYEVRDWCKRFGCTKEDLHEAVKAAGPSVQEVREHLDRVLGRA